jgi:hypothetical protein
VFHAQKEKLLQEAVLVLEKGYYALLRFPETNFMAEYNLMVILHVSALQIIGRKNLNTMKTL